MTTELRNRRGFLKSTAALTGGAVCVGVIGWSDRARAAITVRVAQALPEAAHIVRTTKYWAELVGKKTGGELDVKVFPGGSLINLTEAFDALSLNSVQFSDMANTYATAKTKDVALLDVPGIFPASNVIATDKALREPLNAILHKQDVHFVFAYDLGRNTLALKSGPAVRAPAQLKGKVIRDAGLWQGRLLETWGATPKTVSIGDVVPSIQRGGLDGVMIGIAGLGSLKLHETLKFVTVFPNANQVFYYLAASRKFVESLKPSQRQALEEAAQEALAFGVKAQAEFAAQYLDQIQKGGVEVHRLTRDEEAAFATGVAAVKSRILGELGADGKRLAAALDSLTA